MTEWQRISTLQATQLQQDVLLRGWVRTRRDSKGLAFINLNDGSNRSGIQVIVEESLSNFEDLRAVGTGASLEVLGTLVPSPGKGQEFEVQARQVRVFGLAPGESYPLQKKGHTLEFLREIAHLRPRTNTLGAVFRVRNTLAWAVHQFFQEHGFLYAHTPIITASDTEGAGDLFRVTTLDLEQPPRTQSGQVDHAEDFFGTPVNLTVSGQLGAEVMALSFTSVYTFGPTFRAENSNTSRHLAEFWMIEPEMAFMELPEMVRFTESFLKFLVCACLERNQDDLEFLQKMYDPELIPSLEHIRDSEFKVLSYTEAVRILLDSGKTFEFPVEWGLDLQSEHERYLTDVHFQKPVTLTDYPKEIKAFYMKQNEDGKTVAAMDVLFPRLGEIVGGSQREDSLERLQARMQELDLPESDYDWYLDLRRFGSAPHSGFGLGFERLVQFMTGMKNIRDVIPFPRTPGNARF